MNDKEYNIARAKSDVKEAESKCREAQVNLEEGYKKSQAQIEQAKCDAEKDYKRLKEELERAKIRLDNAKCWLSLKEEELSKGFES